MAPVMLSGVDGLLIISKTGWGNMSAKLCLPTEVAPMSKNQIRWAGIAVMMLCLVNSVMELSSFKYHTSIEN